MQLHPLDAKGTRASLWIVYGASKCCASCKQSSNFRESDSSSTSCREIRENRNAILQGSHSKPLALNSTCHSSNLKSRRLEIENWKCPRIPNSEPSLAGQWHSSPRFEVRKFGARKRRFSCASVLVTKYVHTATLHAFIGRWIGSDDYLSGVLSLRRYLWRQRQLHNRDAADEGEDRNFPPRSQFAAPFKVLFPHPLAICPSQAQRMACRCNGTRRAVSHAIRCTGERR